MSGGFGWRVLVGSLGWATITLALPSGASGAGGTLDDTTPPVLTLPATTTVEATGPDGAAVTYTVTATDDIDPNPTVTCAPAVGATMPLGTTTVTCEATDTSGNVATGAFGVIVHDTTPPRLRRSGDWIDLSRDVDSWAPFHLWFWELVRVQITDDVDPSPELVCDVPDGLLTSLEDPDRPSQANCTATDSAGNTGAFGVDLGVACDTDNLHPFRNSGVRIVAEATGPEGAHVDFLLPDARSDCYRDTRPAPCDPEPGVLYPIGVTTGMCCWGFPHTGACGDLWIEVRDTTPPVIDVPGDVVARAEGPGGAVAVWSEVTATDVVAGTVDVECDHRSGSVFPIGVTMVSCTASDAVGTPSPAAGFAAASATRQVEQVSTGNVATATFTVTVLPVTTATVGSAPAPSAGILPATR